MTTKDRKAYDRKYNEENKEKRREYMKAYNAKRKEPLKQDYEVNKEHKLDYGQQYRIDKASYIKEKMQCERCGCYIGRYDMKRHQRTNKCIDIQNIIQKEKDKNINNSTVTN